MKKLKIIVLLFVPLAIVAWLIARPMRLSGDCMEPAFMDGKLCLVNQILPYIRKYQIDDVVVFKHEGRDWISRIVALENDTIYITENNVVVNDTSISNLSRYINWFAWNKGTYAIDKSFQVPFDHVFVLSDNLDASHDDSRVFGPISKKFISGVVCYCF